MMVLIVLNAVSVIVQLPLRRNKLGKLICGVLAVTIAPLIRKALRSK